MGGCNEGPVVCVGEKFHVHVKAEEVPEMITKLKALADLK
jgi:NADH:ubiquinone oxidoreductase subunit E